MGTLATWATYTGMAPTVNATPSNTVVGHVSSRRSTGLFGGRQTDTPRAAHQNGFPVLRGVGALFDGGTRLAGSDAGGFRPAAASVARYQARVNCVTKEGEGNMSAES